MAYFDGPKSSKNWYARLEYSYSQSASATTINLTLKVYDATGSSHITLFKDRKFIKRIILAQLVGIPLEAEL